MAQSSPERTVQAYLDAIRAGDFQTAESFWTREDFVLSGRLGIEYECIQLKYDCASPIIYNPEIFRIGGLKTIVSAKQVDANTAEVLLQVCAGDTIEFPYYLRKTDAGWKIVSQLKFYTQAWNHRDSEYARVYFAGDKAFADSLLRGLDEFIASAAGKIGIPPGKIDLLRKEKVYYYYCSEEQLRQITGHNTMGEANLQFDAVVSRYPVHKHELAHLLIAFKLEKQPLYTIPFLQEGIAVYLGGRKQTSPGEIFELAKQVLQYEIAGLEDVLTYDGFHKTSSVDAAYALSGLWVKYIVDKAGEDRFFQLYLRLSGDAATVRGLTAEQIKAAISEVVGEGWGELLSNIMTK